MKELKFIQIVLLAAALIGSAGFALNSKSKSPAGKFYGRTVPPQQIFERRNPLDELHPSGEIHLPIPDGPGGVVSSQIDVPENVTIEDVNVLVDITHTWIRDLDIRLISQDNADTVLLLREFPGDSIINMTGTWFDDEAELSIWEGRPPFTDSFRPLGQLDSLDGQLSAGIWTLRIEDRFAIDTGFLESWAIDFNRPVILSGRVTDRESGSPLGQVRVVAEGVDTTSTNSFGRYEFPTVAPGTYTLFFDKSGYFPLAMSNVIVIEGETAVRDTSLERIGALDFPSTSAPVEIPDNSTTGAEMTLAVDSAIIIADLDVTVNITHTFVADLSISLTDPNGVVALLAANPQSEEDNFTNTRFDDDADSSISIGTPPYTGTYQPVQALSRYIGAEALGTWTLRVVDNAPADVGSIENFTLHITPALAADDTRPTIVRDFALFTNYPNPFNAWTRFEFTLSAATHVELIIFNLQGRQVTTLVDSPLGPGEHFADLSAGNLASGIYIAALRTSSQSAFHKIVLLK